MSNVLFDIYIEEYNSALNSNLLSTSPEAQGFEGHWEPITTRNENTPASADYLRSPMYLIRTTPRGNQEEHVASGIYVRITHRRNPITKAWVPITDGEQYFVQVAQRVVANDISYALYLSQKNAT